MRLPNIGLYLLAPAERTEVEASATQTSDSVCWEELPIYSMKHTGHEALRAMLHSRSPHRYYCYDYLIIVIMVVNIIVNRQCRLSFASVNAPLHSAATMLVEQNLVSAAV